VRARATHCVACVGFTIFGDTSLSHRPSSDPPSVPQGSPRPPRNDLRRAARFKASHRRQASLPLLRYSRASRGITARGEGGRYGACGETLLLELAERGRHASHPPSVSPLITPARIRSFVSFAMVTRPDAAACHSKDDNEARASRSKEDRPGWCER